MAKPVRHGKMLGCRDVPNSSPHPMSLSTVEAAGQRRWGSLILVASLLAGAALRAWLSLHDDGIYWPDEIYQSLEPAHRLVYGYGLIAWEFVEGARSWALPGVVAAILKASALFGGTQPRTYLLVDRLFFSAVGTATAYATYQLARTYGASRLAGACAAALFALSAPAIYFAPRAMSETASALPVVLAFVLCLRRDASRWERIAGASLLGLSVMLRLQNGLFCIGLVALFAARRQWAALLQTACTLAVWALLFGLLDKLTWGGWFHSAVVYLRANVIERKAEQWGVSPFSYYARALWTSMPFPSLVIAPLAALSIARAPGLASLPIGFVLLHSLIPHKELRFIFPAVPLLCALAGIGISVLEGKLKRAISIFAAAAALCAATVSAVRFHGLTFGDLGQYETLKPGASAYDDFGPVNRLLLAANGQPDLCGLKVEVVHLAWTGGFTYLHRPVPLYAHFGPPRESGRFNYVITFAPLAAPGQVVGSEGNLALVRLPVQSCAFDPGYQWRLP
ncbi:MAG TPA: hypothetical protein VKE49_12205 [Myxococcaceae bacterium]|nr:hypothetical protein [Myxococcaceae bacterium]